MLFVSNIIDKLIAWIGRSVSWLSLILMILIIFDVIFRYLFSNTKTWIIELEWHLFSLLFLLGAAYAFQKNQHVRVDVLYDKFSPKTQAWINLIGHVVFLIPWCLVIILTATNYGLNSFSFLEGSPNPGGLPARYLIKFSIAVGFCLLLLQAISQICKAIIKIREA